MHQQWHGRLTARRMIKERFQPATSPKVEELHLLHSDTGWSIRIANRLGVKSVDYTFCYAMTGGG